MEPATRCPGKPAVQPCKAIQPTLASRASSTSTNTSFDGTLGGRRPSHDSFSMFRVSDIRSGTLPSFDQAAGALWLKYSFGLATIYLGIWPVAPYVASLASSAAV